MIALFVVGLILLAIAIPLFLLKTKAKRFLTRILPATVLGLIAVVLITVSCIRTVPTGHTGIVTVFGRVKAGLKVVKAIQAVETDANDRPLEDIRIVRAYVVNP